jgi:septal ring factor EnvC (AmiA/AmiB activator)
LLYQPKPALFDLSATAVDRNGEEKVIRQLETIDELLDELKQRVDELNEKQELLEKAENNGEESEAEKISDKLIELEDSMENLKRKIIRELAEI